jgi:glycosidase
MFQNRIMKLLVALAVPFFFAVPLLGQTVERVEPPHWWAGMAHTELQLLIQGDSISEANVRVIGGKRVELVNVHRAESPNFLFLDLNLEGAKPQTFKIEVRKTGSKPLTYIYELKEKRIENIVSVDQSDVIYLITPDRFVNGDQSNDEIQGMKEGLNRAFHGGRHGGDLEGIISRLDYLDALGVTSLWLNPVLENDMPEYSYHGYAITDFYNTDMRYGSNQKYIELSEALHQRGMKLIMDMVFNHCGLEHWWMTDMPFSDWIHDAEDYRITNHTIATISDPYAVQSDRALMEQGWFVPSMPDLNHENPYLANYLIQNSIWWIQSAGLDGIRMDTYPYNNASVMQQWTQRVLLEYPDFFLLGETWVGDAATESYWAPKPGVNNTFNSGLTSTTDFPLCYAIHNAFKENGDVRGIYETLAKDFLYGHPANNTVFIDNHDMDRIFHTLGYDVDRLNLAMTFLLTTRGIPQIYYGTEILMQQFDKHGDIREDFPGGWQDDLKNAFEMENLSADERRAFEHIQQLLNYRKTNPVLQYGALKHFIPKDNLYVYTREYQGKKTMIFINNTTAACTLDMDTFRAELNGFTQGTNPLSGETFNLSQGIQMEPLSSLILELTEMNN